MRIKVLAFAASLFLISDSLAGIPQTPTTTTTARARKDMQAVSVVTQTLDVAGGVASILSVGSYTATGNVTYHFGEELQGTVILKARDLNHFRMDSTLPNGTLSVATSEGRTSIRGHAGAVQNFPNRQQMGPSSPILPFLRLPAALNDPRIDLLYEGLINLDGHSVHEIRVQLSPAGQTLTKNDLRSREYFIDASTYQIVMTKEMLSAGAMWSYRYSAYKSIGSVLIPFFIEEDVDSQKVWSVRLSQINFNTDWQESDFQL